MLDFDAYFPIDVTAISMQFVERFEVRVSRVSSYIISAISSTSAQRETSSIGSARAIPVLSVSA